MKNLKILIPVILVLFLISSISLAKDDIMPLSQIKPGMKGIGKSVFKGTKIEGFNVEIVGIMNLGTRKLIIAKLSGKPKGMDLSLEETGVISAMSGSPVYIDGKNIGAIAYSLGPFHLQALTAITPLESMLKMEKSDDSLEEPVSELSGVPFFVSSHPRELQALFEKQGLNFKILPMGTTGINLPKETDDPAELKPGSSINIVVMEGDMMNLELIGTVTYIDGLKIHGLGHPIFDVGNVSFPFYLSKILTVFPSRDGSYKIFEKRIGEPLGTITLDRSAGIMGILGKKAKMIPLKVSFKTKTKSIELNERIAEFRYSSLLVGLAIQTASEKFFNNEFSKKDHNRDITLKVHLRTLIEGEPEIRTTRYFVVPGSMSLLFLHEELRNLFQKEIYMPLLYSRFPFEFEQISIDVEVLEGGKIYDLDKTFLTKDGKLIENSQFSLSLPLPSGVPLDEASICPGDTVELSIILKNADTLEEFLGKLTIPIPENTGPGPLEILIDDTTSYKPLDPFEQRKIAESFKYPKNLEELIGVLNKTSDRSKLYVQIIYPEEDATANKEKVEKADQQLQKETMPKSKQDNKMVWQDWKEIKETDKLPLLEDEKPSKLIKQIVIPLDFEGIIQAHEKLRFQVVKPKLRLMELIQKKQSLKFKPGLFVSPNTGIFSDLEGRIKINFLGIDVGLLTYEKLQILNFGFGIANAPDNTEIYAKFAPIKVDLGKNLFAEANIGINNNGKVLFGLGFSLKI